MDSNLLRYEQWDTHTTDMNMTRYYIFHLILILYIYIYSNKRIIQYTLVLNWNIEMLIRTIVWWDYNLISKIDWFSHSQQKEFVYDWKGECHTYIYIYFPWIFFNILMFSSLKVFSYHLSPHLQYMYMYIYVCRYRYTYTYTSLAFFCARVLLLPMWCHLRRFEC